MNDKSPLNRRQFLQLSAASSLGLALPGAALAAPALLPWQSDALKLVNGQLRLHSQPFAVRGVVYQPTPIGQDPTVVGSPFTAYADPRIRRRDFPLLRHMGANTLRLYHPRDTVPEFYRDCLSAGLYVILGFNVDTRLDFTADWARRRVLDDFFQFVRAWRGQPSILMWAIGDGVNGELRREGRLGELKAWHSLANAMARVAHETEESRGRPVVLVSSGSADIGLPALGSDDASLSDIDLWGVSHWGHSFDDMFDRLKTQKPLLITEYGRDVARRGSGSEQDQVPRAHTIVNMWNEIAARPDKAVGGCLFEFSDEWWRARPGQASWHEWGGGADDALPDGIANLEWYGLYGLISDQPGLDRLAERSAVRYLTKAWSKVVTIGQPAVWIDVPMDRDAIDARQRVSGHYSGLKPGWEIFLTVKQVGASDLFVQPESCLVRASKGGWTLSADLGPKQAPKELRLELAPLVAKTPQAVAALREAARGENTLLPATGIIGNHDAVRVRRR